MSESVIDPEDQPGRQDNVGMLEGREFRPRDSQELAEAIERAFDYRGNITLELGSGSRIEGYLYNRDLRARPPSISLYPKDTDESLEVPFDQIVAIAFTGQDPASGRSWESWVSKKQSQRKAEAEEAAAAAQARGHL